MKLVTDADLSPRWAAFLEEAGHEAVHWFDVGAAGATDHAIMAWARERNHIVFTHDLDFSALLAATQVEEPSVLQVRAQDVLPDALGAVVLRALRRFESKLRAGAVVTVDASRTRVHVLPLGGDE